MRAGIALGDRVGTRARGRAVGTGWAPGRGARGALLSPRVPGEGAGAPPSASAAAGAGRSRGPGSHLGGRDGAGVPAAPATVAPGIEPRQLQVQEGARDARRPPPTCRCRHSRGPPFPGPSLRPRRGQRDPAPRSYFRFSRHPVSQRSPTSPLGAPQLCPQRLPRGAHRATPRAVPPSPPPRSHRGFSRPPRESRRVLSGNRLKR